MYYIFLVGISTVVHYWFIFSASLSSLLLSIFYKLLACFSIHFWAFFPEHLGFSESVGLKELELLVRLWVSLAFSKLYFFCLSSGGYYLERVDATGSLSIFSLAESKWQGNLMHFTLSKELLLGMEFGFSCIITVLKLFVSTTCRS